MSAAVDPLPGVAVAITVPLRVPASGMGSDPLSCKQVDAKDMRILHANT